MSKGVELVRLPVAGSIGILRQHPDTDKSYSFDGFRTLRVRGGHCSRLHGAHQRLQGTQMVNILICLFYCIRWYHIVLVIKSMKPIKPPKTQRTVRRHRQHTPFEVRTATRAELKVVLENTLRIAIAVWPKRPKVRTAAQCTIS